MDCVAGIDQSVNHTGVCILDQYGQQLCLRLIEPKKLKEQYRLAFVRDTLTEILSAYAIKVVVMEGYSYDSVNKKFLLGEIGSVIKLAVHDIGADLQIAAPKQLKKFVTGSGSADKQMVMHSINALWGIDIDNDNLADAYGLAQIAREIMWPSSTKRYQLDVVKMITNKALIKPRKRGRKTVRNAL